VIFGERAIHVQTDREFFAAIQEDRQPNASVAQVLPCFAVLHDLERQLA
jgi:2-hydroxy-4-carboxymuconate semialdehyde hemiacetal dehydrogenase